MSNAVSTKLLQSHNLSAQLSRFPVSPEVRFMSTDSEPVSKNVEGEERRTAMRLHLRMSMQSGLLRLESLRQAN